VLLARSALRRSCISVRRSNRISCCLSPSEALDWGSEAKESVGRATTFAARERKGWCSAARRYQGAAIYDAGGSRLGEASVALRYEQDRTWGGLAYSEDAFKVQGSKLRIEIPSAGVHGDTQGPVWVDETKDLDRNDLVAFSICGGGPGHFLIEGPALDAARQRP
jgi:hypothetical protein